MLLQVRYNFIFEQVLINLSYFYEKMLHQQFIYMIHWTRWKVLNVHVLSIGYTTGI